MRILYINWNSSLNAGVNVNRVYEILKFLPEKKVEIVHITPAEAFEMIGVKNIVIKNSFKGSQVTKYKTLIKNLVEFGDSEEQRNWVGDIKDYLGKEFKRMGKFDIVYVNTSPYCLSEAGQFAKEIFNCKLVVDFQDAYYFFPYQPSSKFLNHLVKIKEERCLKGVDLLVTNTPSAEKAYKKAYPNLNVCWIPNMIPSNLLKLRKTSTEDRGVIAYGGSLYIGRDLFPILEALKKIEKKFRIEVLGDYSSLNKFRYRKYSNIDWLGKLNRQEYYQYLAGKVGIGVILQSFKVSNKIVSCIAAKTYEYLALQKPVIYIGPEGDNAKMIRDYSKNFCVVTDPKDILKIVKYLTDFKQISDNTKDSFIKDYSSERLCGKLLAKLNQVI